MALFFFAVRQPRTGEADSFFMAVTPERIGYDKDVPRRRAHQSQPARFRARMFHIFTVNPTRIKECGAGLFEGDPMFDLVGSRLL